MAKYKPTNPVQGHSLTVFINKQLQKGTFLFVINHLRLTDLGFEKWNFEVNSDSITTVVDKAKIFLSE